MTNFTQLILFLSVIISSLFSTVVNAAEINREWLDNDSEITALLPTSVFKLPELQPDHNLAGTITLSAIKGSHYFNLIRDDWDLVSDTQWRIPELPEMNFDVVSQQQYLVSNKATIQRSSHPHWEWQVGTGQFSKIATHSVRVVMPFALSEKNANCTHNGWLLFELNSSQQASKGYYQITSETCAYLQFDLAGRVEVEFSAADIADSDTLVARFKQSNRRDSLTAADLISSYPQLNLERLMPPQREASTVSGIVINGTHYQLNCDTRAGRHPDCRQLALPSYSTAKSLYAGLTLMYLEQRVPGIEHVLVQKIIPECTEKKWQFVTLGDLLNMRTGNYLSRDLDADESSERSINFLTAMTHQQRLEMACTMYPNKSKPGKYFVYHTSDTYLAGVMMERLFKQLSRLDDIYRNLVVNSLWSTLNLSPLLDDSKRTYDDTEHTLTGWGLTFTTDDVIKLAEFIMQQTTAEQPMLDPRMMASALQLDGERINREGGAANLAYNYGFWALEVGTRLGCKEPKWLPFMSGFGGISLVFVSADIFYYNFADNYRHVWLEIIAELHQQFPICEVE